MLAGTLQTAAEVVGLVGCVVPGVAIGTVLFAVVIVVMLEGAGVVDAFGRSRELAEKHFWRVLSVLVLSTVIYSLPEIGVGAGLERAFGASTLSNVLRMIVYIVVVPFPSVVSTVLYYDLRIRKDGYGLDDLADLRVADGPELGLGAY